MTAPAALAGTTSASAILAMHARFEAASIEYNRVDEAQPRKPADYGNENADTFRVYFRCEDGMRENAEESELLRHAILYQVPTTDKELSLLAFHAWGLFDYDQNTDSDRRALGQALNSIFDYLVSEGRADMEEMGRQFTNGAMIAFHRRRYRTGFVGEEA